jgi:hypothetical protein
MQTLTQTLFAATATAALAATSQAAVLVYDGFDYTAGNALAGNAGGIGWDGSWQVDSQGGSNSGASVVGGLTFSDYPVLGNAAEVLSNYNGQISGTTYAGTTAARQTATGIGAVSTPTTFYTSILFRQLQTDNSFANESTFSFADTDFGGQQKLISRPVDLFDSDDPQNVAVGPGNEATVGTAGIEAETTYLIISKFENINAPVFGGLDISATLWALDETAYDAIKAGGITESELNANAVATATRTDVGPDFPPSFLGGEFSRLRSVTGFGINNRSRFDELRVFTDLDDVNAVIPEPTSALAISMIGLLGLRRRR